MTVARRVAAVMLACTACFASLAVPALATEYGQTWLNWVWEPGQWGNAGVHAKWYYRFEQAASEVTHGYGSCADGWYGSQGQFVFGYHSCTLAGYEAATPALRDPGVGAYPWAQTEYDSEYLWGWAGYCGTC